MSYLFFAWHQLSLPLTKPQVNPYCDLVSQKCMKDIINILQTKELSVISFTETMEIQQIIWNCTEGKEVDMAYLNALPLGDVWIDLPGAAPEIVFSSFSGAPSFSGCPCHVSGWQRF